MIARQRTSVGRHSAGTERKRRRFPSFLSLPLRRGVIIPPWLPSIFLPYRTVHAGLQIGDVGLDGAASVFDRLMTTAVVPSLSATVVALVRSTNWCREPDGGTRLANGSGREDVGN